MNEKLLIGDIGGTNARFAMADNEQPGFTHQQTLQCTDYATAADAIHDYLRMVDTGDPDVICLAAAGPKVDDTIELTNNAWALSVAELKGHFEIDRVQLLNDFVAIAYSVPCLSSDNLEQVGPLPADSLNSDDYMIGVLGPGTGLGTVGMRRHEEHFIVVNSEAGHIGFAPETDEQLNMLRAMRERLDRVEVEDLVSGVGLGNLHWALGKSTGRAVADKSPAEIFAAAEKGDALAVETVAMFFEIIGQVAGDLALIYGADEGIYIAGGIAQRHAELLKNSRFRHGFERKGGHRFLVERIPTNLITHEQPGLLGTAYCALQMLQHPV